MFEYYLTNIYILSYLIRIFNPVSYFYYYFYPNKFIESCGKMTLRYLNKMGPGFIKLSQNLNNRRDIFPDAFLKEIRCLLDFVPPDYTLVDTLPDNFENLKLLGSGTIGQVYSASISGKSVAVKIKRPKIKERIKDDLIIIQKWIDIIDYLYPSIGLKLKARFILHSVEVQYDFKREKEKQTKFYNRCKDLQNIKVPKIYDEYCTENIIVMELIHGNTISFLQTVNNINFNDNVKITSDLWNLGFSTLFEHDLVHGDVHSGNVMRDQNGCLWIIDFGLTFDISEETQVLFLDYLSAFFKRDIKNLYEIITQKYIIENNENFDHELKIFLEEISSKKITMWDYSIELLNLSKKNGVIICNEYIQIEISVTNIYAIAGIINNGDFSILEEIIQSKVL